MVKAIRGAITVKENTKEEILQNATTLIKEIHVQNNFVTADNIVSIIFSVTNDLTAEYPAKAVRNLGYTCVPLFCVQEMICDNMLEKCIRVLVTVNCNQNDIISHCYLLGAKILRPDLTKEH